MGCPFVTDSGNYIYDVATGPIAAYLAAICLVPSGGEAACVIPAMITRESFRPQGDGPAGGGLARLRGLG